VCCSGYVVYDVSDSWVGRCWKVDDVQAKLGGVHGAAENDWSCAAYNNKNVKRRESDPVYTSRGPAH